jgi:hypothetical protein
MDPMKVKLLFNLMVKSKREFEAKKKESGVWMKLPDKDPLPPRVDPKPALPKAEKPKRNKPTVQIEEYEPHDFQHSTAPKNFWKSLETVPSSNQGSSITERLRKKPTGADQGTWDG